MLATIKQNIPEMVEKIKDCHYELLSQYALFIESGCFLDGLIQLFVEGPAEHEPYDHPSPMEQCSGNRKSYLHWLYSSFPIYN